MRNFPDRLRIATYNIRKGKGTDGQRDPERTLRMIARTKADIVLLQEADYRLAPRPPALDRDQLAEMTGLIPVQFDTSRESLGWHGNALLIRPSFHLSSVMRHDLPGLEPRGMIEAIIKRDGIPLRVIGVHLGLLRSSRRQQLTALNEILDQGGDYPTLVAGDFNERSLKLGLGRLAPQFRILSGGPTYHSRMPLFPLDRIAISHDLTLERIVTLHGHEARLASDHLPLVADLRVGHAPG